IFKGPVEGYFQVGGRVELCLEDGAPTLAEYLAVEILHRYCIDGSRREVILADGIVRPLHTKLANFIVSVDRLLAIVPFVTVKHTTIQYGWYTSAVITPTPRFDFVLPATERNHDAAVIHQGCRAGWRVSVSILPIESGTAGIANGAEC